MSPLRDTIAGRVNTRPISASDIAELKYRLEQGDAMPGHVADFLILPRPLKVRLFKGRPQKCAGETRARASLLLRPLNHFVMRAHVLQTRDIRTRDDQNNRKKVRTPSGACSGIGISSRSLDIYYIYTHAEHVFPPCRGNNIRGAKQHAALVYLDRKSAFSLLSALLLILSRVRRFFFIGPEESQTRHVCIRRCLQRACSGKRGGEERGEPRGGKQIIRARD